LTSIAHVPFWNTWVVTDYTYALDTLDNYDYERLTIDKTTQKEPFHATYESPYTNHKCKGIFICLLEKGAKVFSSLYFKIK